MSYNLNDNVKENFEFILGGFTYQMRYPTIEETEEIQEAFKKAQESQDGSQVLKQVYKFISSNDDKAPSIEDVLKKQNIKVLQNFNEMIKTEFGGE